MVKCRYKVGNRKCRIMYILCIAVKYANDNDWNLIFGDRRGEEIGCGPSRERNEVKDVGGGRKDGKRKMGGGRMCGCLCCCVRQVEWGE